MFRRTSRSTKINWFSTAIHLKCLLFEMAIKILDLQREAFLAARNLSKIKNMLLGICFRLHPKATTIPTRMFFWVFPPLLVFSPATLAQDRPISVPVFFQMFRRASGSIDKTPFYIANGIDLMPPNQSI